MTIALSTRHRLGFRVLPSARGEMKFQICFFLSLQYYVLKSKNSTVFSIIEISTDS